MLDVRRVLLLVEVRPMRFGDGRGARLSYTPSAVSQRSSD